ncbi:EVE domain-containing protein [Legionella sp. W05-934-2]|uniref:EVE domain-containing protein n=1 Tax=Legionella sp. W05-934-2 TaxID=1198649 RepID=UPI0034637CAB
MQYWLMKSEPDCFSIDDLRQLKNQTTCWDGVRNYQARNMMRDDMAIGDLVFFYHSNCDTPGIVGLAEVASKPYPDHTAFDPEDDHYDPKSMADNPRWFMVDVKFKEKFNAIIPLHQLKEQPELEGMQLLRKGNRLSVMPIQPSHWHFIMNSLNR